MYKNIIIKNLLEHLIFKLVYVIYITFYKGEKQERSNLKLNVLKVLLKFFQNTNRW